jgi:hypothetical protein
MLRRKLPLFHTAEDLEVALANQGEVYRKQDVQYELAFPDSEENRLRILRFLLGGYFDEVPRQAMVDLFDSYAHAGQIVIQYMSSLPFGTKKESCIGSLSCIGSFLKHSSVSAPPNRQRLRQNLLQLGQGLGRLLASSAAWALRGSSPTPCPYILGPSSW